MNTTNDTVIIAHDYLCPWCWIGYIQSRRLAEEYPQIKQDWRGYELIPESLGPLPDYKPQPRNPDDPPTRIELLQERDGIIVPPDRTFLLVRTHDALQGAEYAKDKAPDRFDAYNGGVYRAFWERSEDISDHGVLGAIAEQAGLDKQDFLRAIAGKEYSSRIVGFDEPAYADDVTHVPTFIFFGERCAEAPYATIKEMTERFIAWKSV